MPTASLLQCGDKFNNWTFVKHCEERKGYAVYKCECGKEKEVLTKNVLNNSSTNCGCIKPTKRTKYDPTLLNTGTVYGWLTITGEPIKIIGKHHKEIPCVCACGNKLMVRTDVLRKGLKDNCGCKTVDKFRDKRYVKIETGTKYNRLTVLRELEPVLKEGGRYRRQIECVCDCGNIKTIEAHELLLGGTKSCGCLKEEVNKTTLVTHGLSKTNTYRIWAGIKQRCINSDLPSYKYYGGRGITMCDRWNDSYENFLEDMGERPSKQHSIDRIDYNGNYEPNNCRWATQIEQARNKSNNHLVTYAGQTKVFAEWAEYFGVDYDALWNKCRWVNWDTDKIFDKIIGF
jgi:hypothetical protein